MDLTVYITSPLISSERRISSQWSIEFLKRKLQPITGIEPHYQQLFIYPVPHSSERIEIKSENESMTLLQLFNIKDLMRIHVKDLNPEVPIEDDGLEGSYQLSKEDYAKRSDSVMAWKRDQKLGRFDPNFEKKRQEQRLKISEKLPLLQIGQRCRIVNDTTLVRTGTIKYIGKIPEIDGDEGVEWCGVELDQQLGKNDGSVKGVRYFQCSPQFGSFVSPLVVEIGEFDEDMGSDTDDEL